MKASIKEHDDSLELVITAETYEEHILVKAFLREHRNANYIGLNALPISDHMHGLWALVLGQCGCEARARQAEKSYEPPAPCKHKNIAACSDLSLCCQDCGVTVDLDGVPVKSDD